MDQLQVETAAIPMDVLTTRRYCPLGLDSAWIRKNSRGATTQDNMAGHIQLVCHVANFKEQLCTDAGSSRFKRLTQLNAVSRRLRVRSYLNVFCDGLVLLFYFGPVRRVLSS